MEYTISRLAKMAGISARTLRFYDECGLLTPRRLSSSGYRVYGQAQVDRLQQILFYRELGVGLSEISRILSSEDFDGEAALHTHLHALRDRRARLDLLIENVDKSIRAMEGEAKMSDEQKFEGFKRKLIEDNENEYGEELRAKYGESIINASNARLMGMDKAQYDEAANLSNEISDALKAAFEQGDPGSELAQKVCELHKRWLCLYWESYSKQAHIGLAQMYVDDPRFSAYYDKIAPGCAVFLRDAVKLYCS